MNEDLVQAAKAAAERRNKLTWGFSKNLLSARVRGDPAPLLA